MRRIIIGISGSSGVWMGYRLLQLMKKDKEIETHLVMSEQAIQNITHETDLQEDDFSKLADFVYCNQDLGASIASGSFITDGMIVVPCSMKSLAGIATGFSDNLLLRAADVCLKEKRRVVLIPREMPLGRIHIKNMLLADELGCVVLPPMLSFYNQVNSIEGQVDHILGKALLQFGLRLDGFFEWQGKKPRR